LTKVKKRRITVQSAKAKGRRLQQDVCRLISDLTGIIWGKDCDIESRGGGQSGTDVILRGDAKTLFPYDIEAKSQEVWSVPAYIEQARKYVQKDHNWLLVLKKKSLKDSFALVTLKHFFELHTTIRDLKRQLKSEANE